MTLALRVVLLYDDLAFVYCSSAFNSTWYVTVELNYVCVNMLNTKLCNAEALQD